MGETQVPGHTAAFAAVARALHLSTDRERLIDDRVALDLSGDGGAALMAQLTAQTPREALEDLSLAFAIRARFVEDMVARASQGGVAQYVILGAGLDTFAYRRSDLVGRLRVFEVDRPIAQSWKRARLAELGISPPAQLSFVPVDFEANDVGGELIGGGLDASRPAVVSWIGVIPYLGGDAIDRVLRWVAALPRTSQLVLTYVVPPDQLPELAQAGLAWTMSQAAVRGEPFRSLFRPREMAARLRDAGFTNVELVKDDELRRLYLERWPEATLTGIERIAVAGV